MIYLKSIFMHIKCEMEYKLSFILTMISATLNSVLQVLATIILITKFKTVGEWGINEIIFTTALSYFGFAFTEMFARGFDMLHTQIKEGLLDRILVRPLSISYQVFCSDFDVKKIGRLIGSICLLLYGIFHLNVNWSIDKIAVLLLTIFGTMIVFFSILVLKASFSFWTIEGMEIMNVISDGGRDFACYPVNIYAEFIKNIVTFILPFGMVNYFPLLYILEKDGANTLCAFAPFYTIFLLLFSMIIWKVATNKYQSTGS